MSISTEANSLRQTVEALSDEASYGRLFHSSRDEEALPSSENLKRIIDLCRAILFPGFYGTPVTNLRSMNYHTGVNIEKLYQLLIGQIRAGLCFADEEKQHSEKTDKSIDEIS